MSEQTKQDMITIKEKFQKISTDADALSKLTKPVDGGLSEKLKRVKESAQEVFTHIEERTGGPTKNA